MTQPDLSAMDPAARRLLAMIALGGPHDAAKVTPDERRASFAKLMRFSRSRDAPLGVADHSVPGCGGTIPLRLYVPEGIAPIAPGLIYFHGGGLVAGGLDTHDALCRTLAHGARCRIVAVDYRLAPEHPFPAAILDAIAAVRWCLGNAAALGLRAGAIGIGGDSGGATLAAIVARTMRRRAVLKAQILLCPVLLAGIETPSRRRFGSGFLLDAATMASDLVHYAPRRPLDDQALSPGSAPDLAGLPPTIIHTAGFDPLVDEGAAHARRLVAAGVPVTYRCHDALVHHFYGLDGVIPAARDALAQVTRDIAAALA